MAKHFIQPNELPYVNPADNIPSEVTIEEDLKVKRDINIIHEKSRKIAKLLMKKGSNLSKVSNYLWDYFKENYNQPLSISKIAHNTGISEKSIPTLLSELTGLENYAFRIIPARDSDHKRIVRHIQLSTRNFEDSQRWLMTRTRSMAWSSQRMDMTEQSIATKKLNKRLKVKVKHEVENEV